MSLNTKLSRRRLLANTLIAGEACGIRRSHARTSPVDRISPLAGGLEVRDYRLFPTADVTRFLVEVHNTTDEPVDAPTLGMILDNLPSSEGFGVANPGSPVIHPNSSEVLIGVAPGELVNAAEWGIPEWILCQDIRDERSEEFKELNLALTYDIEVQDDNNLHILASVANNGHLNTNSFRFGGCVRDIDGRVCGLLPSLDPWWAQADQVNKYPIDIWHGRDYIGNPFLLVESAHEMTVTLNLQPAYKYEAPYCPSVMPWNR